MKFTMFKRRIPTIAACLCVALVQTSTTRIMAQGRKPNTGSKSEISGMSNGDVAETVQRLWDLEQIKQLKARYFRLMDTRQWKQLRTVFTNDFKWYSADGDGKQVLRASPEATVQWLTELFEPDRAISVHHGHMPEIEFTSPTTARGIWAMFDWVDIPNKRAFQGFGHYYEEYQKGADGKWRIKSIRLVRIRVDDMTPSKENKQYPRGLAPWWPPTQ